VYEEDQIIGKSLLTTGGFQEDKIVEVTDYLWQQYGFKPELFVDIGANIGTHSIFCLKNKICEHAVLFEPDPDNFHLLKRNIGANNLAEQTTLFQLALSSNDGEIEMELSNFNFGDHRIRPSVPAKVSFGEETERATVSIPSNTLDHLSVTEHLAWPGALVWIDTQGHEGYIFEGGANFLHSETGPRFLVSEFWPYGIERSDSKNAYFDFLRSCHSIYDINQPDWQSSNGISVAALEASYEIMLSETEKEHHPHTDLLLILKPAAESLQTAA
jgi:FkbM family methyltransferase